MSNFPLEFNQVNFTYDKSIKVDTLLYGLSFALRTGEITGLLGANGTGKSTLLKCAIGLLYPNEGSITQFGVPIKNLEQVQRTLFGYDAVDVNFPSHLNIREILDFVKSTYLTWDEALEEKLLKHFFGIDKFDKISQLSTGAIRKLGIMCAVCHKPKLILLDESLSGLDIESRLYIIDLLGELASQGASVLYATHILPDIERLSDNVLVLKNGKTECVESVEAIPENYFVIEEHMAEGFSGRLLRRYQNKYLVHSTVEEMELWRGLASEKNTYIKANLEMMYLSIVHGEVVR